MHVNKSDTLQNIFVGTGLCKMSSKAISSR